MMHIITRSLVFSQAADRFLSFFLISAAKHCRDIMSKSALIVLAPGAEEVEFTISADVLRRAGMDVTVAGLAGAGDVKCSRDLVIRPDVSLQDVADKTFDIVILPGGLGGSNAMAENTLVGEILKKQADEGRYIGAICAAPIALAAHNIFPGKALTSYPSMKEKLVEKYKYIDDHKVVHDDKLITSRGPGTAFDFALKITQELVGTEKAKEVAKAMLLSY